MGKEEKTGGQEQDFNSTNFDASKKIDDALLEDVDYDTESEDYQHGIIEGLRIAIIELDKLSNNLKDGVSK